MPPDAALAAKSFGGLGRTEVGRVRWVVGAQAWPTWRPRRRRWWRPLHRLCLWFRSFASGQREFTTWQLKRRCQMRCQCSHDQHDTQPNERPHCTFVAVVAGAAAALGAIDEHVLLSGAARHGRAHMHMTVVVVFVILHLADLTLATLPDGRLGAAPSHASPSATCQLFARRLGIKRHCVRKSRPLNASPRSHRAQATTRF